DALGIAGDQVAPFDIGRQRVGWLRGQRDAVAGDEVGQHLAVTALFPAVAADGLAPRRIVHRLAIGRHAGTGLVLSADGDVPYRQAGQPPQRLRLQLRPRDHGRLVGVERVAEHLAGGVAVAVRADGDATG